MTNMTLSPLEAGYEKWLNQQPYLVRKGARKRLRRYMRAERLTDSVEFASEAYRLAAAEEYKRQREFVSFLERNGYPMVDGETA